MPQKIKIKWPLKVSKKIETTYPINFLADLRLNHSEIKINK